MTEPKRRAPEMLTRRTLLRMTAAAAGTVALPTALTASVSASPATTPGLSAVAPDLLTDDVFPIGLFWPPPQRWTTQQRYDEIAEAGFTLVLGGNDVNNMPANDAMLRFADGAGLRALPVDERISHAVPCPGWENDVLATLEEYQAYNAFAGFRIDDEPSPVDYPRYRMIADVLTGAAPQYLSHFNLVPFYQTQQDAAYRQFLQRYIVQIAPSFVSFDHYPLLTDGTIRPTYFVNHRRVREASNDANLPSWVYIQSVDHGIMKRPTFAELAWQINISLAYGCKGIQYFTYCTPDNASDFVFGAALIDKDGNRTQVYYDASRLNRTHLRPVGRELKHLRSMATFHANESPLPFGAEPFDAERSAAIGGVSGSAVVLGEFRRTGEPTRWIFAANRSFTASANATLTVKPSVEVVAEFDPATGAYGPIPLTPTPSGRGFGVDLGPGGGRLYRVSLPAAQPPA